MTKLSKNQWMMMCRLYRNQIKNYGYYGTGWTSQYSVHKASIEALMRKGLVITRMSAGLELPSGYGQGNQNVPLYMLNNDGVELVRANTPVLIGVPVLWNSECYMVISWSDDYSSVEILKSDVKYPIHVAPGDVQVIQGVQP